MTAETVISGAQPAGATRFLRFVLTDADGVTPMVRPDLELQSLQLTLYAEPTGTVIAERSVLNTGGGTVFAEPQQPGGYNVELRLDPADMIVVGSGLEPHVALLRWTWGDPLKVGLHAVHFSVVNLDGHQD